MQGVVECTVEEGWSLELDLRDELEGTFEVTLDFTDLAGNVATPKSPLRQGYNGPADHGICRGLYQQHKPG